MNRRRRTGTHTGPCRWCRNDVLWLTNVTTGRVAPIDPLPVPRGNIAVDRNPDGTLVGTYTVLAGVDRDAADPTFLDIDAQPTLRLMHRLTCENMPADARGHAPAPTTPPPATSSSKIHRRRTAMSSNRRAQQRAIAESRRLEARGRTQLAAGISNAMAAVDAALRRFVNALEVDAIGERVRVDDETVRVAAIAIGEVVHGAIADTVGLTIRDPRLLSNAGIVGPGMDDAFSHGTVVIDTTTALLLGNLAVCQVDPGDNDAATVVTALAISGRVNRSADTAQITVVTDVDGVASFITELYALAARGGWAPALDAAVDQKVAALPTPSDPEGTSDQP